MATPSPPPEDGRPAGAEALAQAVRRLLRPLVRLLLEKQITFPVLSSWVRSLYVEVAERELALRERRRQTDSRISLLTGLHRKEVKRLRGALAREQRPAPVVALGALLVSRWIADPETTDAAGRPIPLPRLPRSDGGASFESFVSSVSRDIPPRSVLDEWLRLGVVELDEQDRVRLRADSFVPERGLEEKIHFFGRNARDHLAAGVHNVLQEGEPFVDRSVYYDELGPESAAELAAFSREKGAELVREINKLALRLQRRDRKRLDATQRMTFGIYFFSVDESEEQDEGDADG